MYQIGGLKITDQSELAEEDTLHFSCSSENFGPTVLLDGYDAFFTDREKKIIPGVTSLKIPTYLVSSNLTVDLNDPLTAGAISVSNRSETHHQGRALRGRTMTVENNKNTGSYSILVVRVSDTHGNSPTYSARKISNDIFNGHVSLVSLL